MDEIANIIANFCQTLKQEIFEYYDRCHSYIKDLFADKKIDLTFKVSYEPPKKLQATLDTMVKSIKLALDNHLIVYHEYLTTKYLMRYLEK